jgi:triphosphoribosyl-dephospho-CoA synthase
MCAEILSTNLLSDAGEQLQRGDHLAALARQALIAEAELTPKPGLVDRRGPGAHADLSLELIRLSATVLETYFAMMAFFSADQSLGPALREELAVIGRGAECAMYNATNGSNAHKGAIWIIGLLVAAAARTERPNAEEIAAVAGSIARLPDRAQPAVLTHGEIAKIRYGVGGARAEASNNFPHVIEFGLPTLRNQRAAGSSEEGSRMDALLSIMSRLDDTCVLHRGGPRALNLVKAGAYAVLMAGGYATAGGRKELCKLDREMIAWHVSPGGSADLLAATIFLDAIERRLSNVHKDQSEWEGDQLA